MLNTILLRCLMSIRVMLGNIVRDLISKKRLENSYEF